MEKFTVLTGVAAPLPMINVDTDKIIPKQFLKTIKRTGLGQNLFFELRYEEDGTEKTEFILNKSAYRKASILVAGENFGCGSSREQAATCIKAAGVAAIIAPSFSRIFFRNAINSGLPVIELSEGADAIQTGEQVGIDFSAGVVEHDGKTYSFPPLPPEVLAILEDGGRIPHVKKALNG